MVNHTQDFVAVKKYEILQYSLIPTVYDKIRIAPDIVSVEVAPNSTYTKNINQQ